ncbi:ABC transporter ATP-binding protein/permease [Inediibacterium massiliense]|uniref:ABC transporter ATP-binding protein/permease n=1 Tax=Inediibacterium massiliense TaxID=1658111 RepID=UPI0006B4D6FA|nr:ABC transporter ATP-binding protein/permease [Inediibacterium massiliense]
MFNKRLIQLVPTCKRWIFLTVFINWLGLILNIGGIFSIASYIEYIYLYGVSWEKSIVTLWVLIGIVMGRLLCNYIGTKMAGKCSKDARITLRHILYKKLLDLGIHYQEMTSTSEVVQVAIDGIERLDMYFGRYLPQFFYSLIAPITLFTIISFINIKIAVVLLGCVPLIPISIIAVMKIAKNLLSKYWGIYVNLGDTFLENLRGLTTLKIYGRDEEKNEQMNQQAENFRKITMKVLAMQLNSITIMDFIAFGGSALGIIFVLKEFIKLNITIGGGFFIILLASEFFIPLRVLGSCFHIAIDGLAAADKIFSILDIPVIKYPTKKIKDFNHIDIRFKNVNFSYEEDRKILKDIHLDIENGQITGLVGSSGCGKSTIANIIMGFYKNYDGEILLNEYELRSIDPAQLRKKINVVTNNSYIFTGTIEENLKMGKSNVTQEEMYEVLKKVNLYEFVLSLEKGLQTQIKEGGANLSGGQRQRLALARALLYDSEIYIFDEATSNIDVESENIIMNLIYELGKVKTVILISHRLYNVRGADKIYVLSNGEIQQVGNHQTLIDEKGLYAQLVYEQNELENIGGESCA